MGYQLTLMWRMVPRCSSLILSYHLGNVWTLAIMRQLVIDSHGFKVTLRAMAAKVWTPDQRCQPHLGTWQKCKFSNPTPDLLNQEHWGVGPTGDTDGAKVREPPSQRSLGTLTFTFVCLLISCPNVVAIFHAFGQQGGLGSCCLHGWWVKNITLAGSLLELQHLSLPQTS